MRVLVSRPPRRVLNGRSNSFASASAAASRTDRGSSFGNSAAVEPRLVAQEKGVVRNAAARSTVEYPACGVHACPSRLRMGWTKWSSTCASLALGSAGPLAAQSSPRSRRISSAQSSPGTRPSRAAESPEVFWRTARRTRPGDSRTPPGARSARARPPLRQPLPQGNSGRAHPVHPDDPARGPPSVSRGAPRSRQPRDARCRRSSLHDWQTNGSQRWACAGRRVNETSAHFVAPRGGDTSCSKMLRASVSRSRSLTITRTDVVASGGHIQGVPIVRDPRTFSTPGRKNPPPLAVASRLPRSPFAIGATTARAMHPDWTPAAAAAMGSEVAAGAICR